MLLRVRGVGFSGLVCRALTVVVLNDFGILCLTFVFISLERGESFLVLGITGLSKRVGCGVGGLGGAFWGLSRIRNTWVHACYR